MEIKDNESTGFVHKLSICNYKAVNTLTLPHITHWPLTSQDLKSPFLSLSQVKYSSAKPGDLCQTIVFPTIKYWIPLLGVIQESRLHNYLQKQPLYFSLKYKKLLTAGQILLSVAPVQNHVIFIKISGARVPHHTRESTTPFSLRQFTSPASCVPVALVAWRFLFCGTGH